MPPIYKSVHLINVVPLHKLYNPHRMKIDNVTNFPMLAKTLRPLDSFLNIPFITVSDTERA